MVLDRILILLCSLLLIFSSHVFAALPAQQKVIAIPPQMALPIGIKIWFNESGGKILGLTSWNKNEDFASLGIGHFIWAPFPGRSNGIDGFPKLIKYMEQKGVLVPSWLHGALGRFCPWRNRQEFLREQNSPRMSELRVFLQQTITIQAQYMAESLEQIFPELLAAVEPYERPYLCQQFYTLAKSPSGIYAMVDYLNFKGAGVGVGRGGHKIDQGTGLLQVLEGMRLAPAGMKPQEAFVWSAKNALIRRVQQTSARYRSEQWLVGWIKRVNTYLE